MPSELTDLRVQNLKIQMPDFTLLGDFKIQVGERIALVGKSGSGKTTLLRALAGLDPMTEGTLSLGQKEITSFSPQLRRVGFIFQEQALFDSMNVLENASFALRMLGEGRKPREEKAMEWLRKVGLESRAHSRIATLSGGERQRVAFVRALIGRPQFILLDEPFSSLDSELRHDLRSEFLLLHNLWPAPVLLVSHDEGDIQSLATGSLTLEWNPTNRLRKISRQLTKS